MLLFGPYLPIGRPERCVEWCRAQLGRGRDTHTLTRTGLVVALTIAGSHDEAGPAANSLIDAVDATRNPWGLSYALLAYGMAVRDVDPARALDALRRGLVIAQESGNRANETHLADPGRLRGQTRARMKADGHPGRDIAKYLGVSRGDVISVPDRGHRCLIAIAYGPSGLA